MFMWRSTHDTIINECRHHTANLMGQIGHLEIENNRLGSSSQIENINAQLAHLKNHCHNLSERIRYLEENEVRLPNDLECP